MVIEFDGFEPGFGVFASFGMLTQIIRKERKGLCVVA
jgi:hypothetical protein